MHKYFSDQNGYLKQIYDSGDGIHLNTAGYRAYIDSIKTII
jgi:lysophospholipase L1-like esterase